ncbi:hypothetical protein [Streptomyces sp. NPDC005141]
MRRARSLEAPEEAVQGNGCIPTLAASGPDAAWRAAALLHTIVRLEPLPHRDSLFAAFLTGQYVDRSGEGIDPPYGTLSDLIGKARETRLSNYDIAGAQVASRDPADTDGHEVTGR